MKLDHLPMNDHVCHTKQEPEVTGMQTAMKHTTPRSFPLASPLKLSKPGKVGLLMAWWAPEQTASGAERVCQDACRKSY